MSPPRARAAALPNFDKVPSLTSPIFWHFVRRLWPWLAAVAAYVLCATLVVRWDMARNGEPLADFGADLYGMYTQIFFEPTATLPRSTIARAVFWLTPLFGLLLIVRGVVRVGASVFDVGERKRLWVKIMTDRMREHVVVCGLGHVGIRVVEALKGLGTPVVALDKSANDSFAVMIERMGIPVIVGDVRNDDLLLSAGIDRARAVVCATDDDLVNLEVAIDAKRMNPKIRVVMRIFDQRVAGKIGDALALEQTFSTAALAGPLVALQAIEPGVLGVYRRANGTLRVDLEIAAPATWWGKTVSQCEDLVGGRVVDLLRRDASGLRPRHDTRIEEGDTVTLDVPAEEVARLSRLSRADGLG